MTAHRRVVYVAGETSPWPSLTGAETLHLLGRVEGRVDLGYRDELLTARHADRFLLARALRRRR